MKKIGLLLLTVSLCFNYSFSQAPSIGSYVGHVLCPDAYGLNIAISNIDFVSSGGDSVFITTVDVPPGVFSGKSFENQTGVKSMVSLSVLNGGATGLFDITVNFKSATSAIFSDIIQVRVADRPIITANSADVCSSENEIDLNTLVSPKGGSFFISPGSYRPENGIFDVEEFLTTYSSNTSFDYQYTVVDQYGCEFKSSTVTTNNIISSPKISLDNLVNTTCGNKLGEVSTTVLSGSTSYSGYWNNGAQGVDEIVGLAPGDYYYTVTNDLGCIEQLTAVVETDGFEINEVITDVACKGGSDGKIDISMPSGSGNYKIEWSTGHTITNVTGLSAGIYRVRVIDLDNGCESHKSFQVNEPAGKFSVAYSFTEPIGCGPDGDITNDGYDFGNSPYTYQWNNGETTTNLTGVEIGHYEVVVMDSKGCEAKYGVDLYPSNEMPPGSRVKHPTCGDNNGAIYITGFTYYPAAPITYLWSNGSTTQDISGLSAGVYTVEIDFGFGCPLTQTFELVNSPFTYTPDICIVTVDTASNTNLIVWEKETGNPNSIAYYNIYRTDATTGEYQLIDSVSYASNSVFNDVYASPERRSWLYKISAVNTCGQEGPLSAHHKTIHLVMVDGSIPGDKILTWDHYEGLEYFSYNLHRRTDIDGWQLIEGNIQIVALPEFLDEIPAGATEVDYIIEVVPTTGGCNPTSTKAQDYNSSRSNRPTPIFDFGEGADIDVSNIATYENIEFKALVYPNPSNGDFKIEIKDNISDQNLNMVIMGMNGNVVHQQGLNNDLNTVQLNVDAGMYFVQIQGENTLETIRIVIQ